MTRPSTGKFDPSSAEDSTPRGRLIHLFNPMKHKLFLSSALAALGLCAFDAGAVGARRFVRNSLDSFKGGDIAGVALGSDGTVRAGLTLAKQPLARPSQEVVPR